MTSIFRKYKKKKTEMYKKKEIPKSQKIETEKKKKKLLNTRISSYFVTINSFSFASKCKGPLNSVFLLSSLKGSDKNKHLTWK